MNPHISIIIPAYNAAATLEATLESLWQQTRADWEAIIVDDGSTDDTGAIAHQAATQDSRIRVISQMNQGAGAARNAGANLAQASWLLFLDANDWIAPDYIARMLAQAEEDKSLNVVHCGWVRVASDHSYVGEQHPPLSSDLFSILAYYCPLIIHSCIVKRVTFQRAGGFDASLATCEDWDLWQRIARQGARFGGVSDVLAYYQMHPQSLSGNGHQVFLDGLRVLRQGYAPDPRVIEPHPDYRDGLPIHDLSCRQLEWAVWPAGLLMGVGQDAVPLIASLDGKAQGLEPYAVASSLFESVPLPTACPPQAWWQLWPAVSLLLERFLATLEAKAEAPGLAHRISTRLERMILENAQNAPWPLHIGKTYGVLLDVAQPITDIAAPEVAERLYVVVMLAGQRLGTLDLPICDGRVSHLVLKDSIARKFFWPILGQFLAEGVYRHGAHQYEDAVDGRSLHDQMGWVTFLQDLWDRPDWTNHHFYNASFPDPAPQTLELESNALTLEISQPFPNIVVSGSELPVVLTVGGLTFGRFSVPVVQGKVSAQALRVALTLEGGSELCCVVVREALLGQSFSQNLRLRHRLAELAQQRSKSRNEAAVPGFTALYESEDLPHTLILGQRPGVLGSSVSRWATLPAQAAEDLMAMAAVTGEAIAHPVAPASVKQIVYAPDAFVASQHNLSFDKTDSQGIDNSSSVEIGFNNRDHFEALFAAQPDPWKYTTAYEQTKYEQTLSLLPHRKIKRALELACAEGHFTAQLAPYVQSLLATDISQIAVERAAQRCAQFSHIQFKQLDMAADPLPESLQLIVCSEVLYYIGGWPALHHFAQKVFNALEPGGYFLTAHAHLVVDEPDRPGYNWDHPFGAKGMSDAFHAVEGLKLVKELRTPLYRIQLFQKEKRTWLPQKKLSPTLVELPQPTPPPERVANTVLWQGGQPQRSDAKPVCTEHLPILMYHRVAPEGDEAMGQWRVTPEAFAEQLHYLRSAGYYTVSLATWQRAIATRTPLPGRAIVLTFDDGYLDFLTYAHPILQTYGFSATVFLVAEQVGGFNRWDASYGERVPLMNWEQIRQLHTQGIEFGSHCTTHQPLTALSVEEVVREGVRSRTILTRELGTPIQTIAYPYGDVDPVIQHLMGACGYTIGVSCRSGRSSLYDELLSLPRLEIEGRYSLRDFVRKLNEY